MGSLVTVSVQSFKGNDAQKEWCFLDVTILEDGRDTLCRNDVIKLRGYIKQRSKISKI